ncbi:MAG: phosphate ABC transporter permease family protein, partial [Alteraurantiacibacter sp.]
MSPVIPLLLALGLGLAGWLVARARAWTFKRAAPEGRLASLPDYHAWYAALWIAVPTLLFFVVWNYIGGQLITGHVLASPEAAALPETGLRRDTILNEAYAIATGSNARILNDESRALAAPYAE